MVNELTLKIRYRPGTKLQTITIQTEENGLTVEEVATMFAEKLTDNYKKYLGKMSKRDYDKYMYGQYKLILQYLEVKI